jgi:FkbM family methyltransferase
VSPVPSRLKRLAERVLPASAMRLARIAYFDLRRRRYPQRVVEHSYGGARHKVVIATEYGERNDQDWPELAEIAWLKRGRLQPGARVFDLGASHGVVAMMLADAVGAEGAVIALEAHPADAATLSRNRDMNGLAQLECLHAAVARESGIVPFGRNGSVDDGTRRWGDRPVPAVSIDDLAKRYGPPDVVFVDVEGYELEALRGAPDTLAAGPEWFVEVHDPQQLAAYGATTAEVVGLLTRAGYEVWTLTDAGYEIGPDGNVRPRGALRTVARDPRGSLRGALLRACLTGTRLTVLAAR